jgi:hypothetical protein
MILPQKNDLTLLFKNWLHKGSTSTLNCPGKSIMGGNRLSIIAAGMSWVNPLYRMVISKAFNKVKASGKERVACLILFLSGSIL